MQATLVPFSCGSPGIIRVESCVPIPLTVIPRLIMSDWKLVDDELVSLTLHCIDTVSSVATLTLQWYTADSCAYIGAEGVKVNSAATVYNKKI